MNPTNRPTRAVLWDMDGTLIDSIPQHWQAWQDVLRQFNLTVDHGVWNQTVGMRNNEIIPLLFPDMSPADAAYVDRAKEARYRNWIRRRHRLLSGVADWIQRFQQRAGNRPWSSAPPKTWRRLHVLHFNGTFKR
jgi:beta-phosphoglucomutase-like phosphatase (HAD superfamily)